MADAPPGWLHSDRLRRVWHLVGDALERRGLEARGALDLRDLTRDERHALTDVMGGPVTEDAVRLRLDELDDRLRSRTGRDLAALVTWLTGRALVDRAGRRRIATARREEPFEAARQWLESSWLESSWLGRAAGEVVVPSWVDDWLNGLRRDGVLMTVPDGGAVLVTALAVLDARGVLTGRRADGSAAESGEEGELVPPAGLTLGVVARTELAARATGSAHGLDDGTKVALVVLRAAAARSGVSLPRSALQRRQLWESLGVVVDRVSATCLTWNLQPVQGSTPRVVELAPAGEVRPVPRHVTWWDLETGLGWVGGQHVLVCENPRTLEALAESREAGRIGVVCTMGRANLVVAEVLGRLVRSGAVLRYHGDFDWPGVALANTCLKDFGAQPWLMSVDDYLAAYGTHELSGRTVEADWDPELAPAMGSRGVAVHEEAVLAQVLERLPELVT